MFVSRISAGFTDPGMSSEHEGCKEIGAIGDHELILCVDFVMKRAIHEACWYFQWHGS